MYIRNSWPFALGLLQFLRPPLLFKAHLENPGGPGLWYRHVASREAKICDKGPNSPHFQFRGRTKTSKSFLGGKIPRPDLESSKAGTGGMGEPTGGSRGTGISPFLFSPSAPVPGGMRLHSKRANARATKDLISRVANIRPGHLETPPPKGMTVFASFAPPSPRKRSCLNASASGKARESRCTSGGYTATRSPPRSRTVRGLAPVAEEPAAVLGRSSSTKPEEFVAASRMTMEPEVSRSASVMHESKTTRESSSVGPSAAAASSPSPPPPPPPAAPPWTRASSARTAAAPLGSRARK
mmetsp:Transcript_62134/g.140542  ORF Transcript_62134/g.140542 Transcript_62134/m.140542 type:complete len:297 (-) Transcript_62134:1044-1934(-)